MKDSFIDTTKMSRSGLPKQEQQREQLLNRANETGFFLQESALAFFRKYRKRKNFDDPWVVSFLEQPFTYPPSNRREGIKGEPGAVDVLAASFYPSTHHNPVIYIIECKRPRPNASHWVFFSRYEETQKPKYVQYDFYDQLGTGRWQPYINSDIHFRSLNMSSAADYPFVYNGFELHENMKKSNGAIEEKIYKPLLQVTQATFATAINERFRTQIQKAKGQWFSCMAFLPIVLTTARLYINKHDPNDIDLVTGTLTLEQSAIEEVDWVAYQFPVPDFLLPPLLRPDDPTPPRPDYLTVLIVRSDFLPNFYECTQSSMIAGLDTAD